MANKSHIPPEWEKHHAKAIQDLCAGEASEHQQKNALEFIINDLCGTYDLSYRPDSSRATDFAEGKRFVGLQLVKLLKINIGKLKDE